ncbi:hypothetical protein [Flavisolibacter ginsenosidimutans]|uniref:tRNA_anti-like n=1 Tax=Flavisolibacter ginsenosidimutans TaxID=661481 RepID=A0A5B8UDM1_9BACT|nr:hypothetical protein [Flavisolibacter ginsenosidimutans]QEC54781.1 hypothetical protein FSB75_02315 [Flavisolibacter ginsenosidimutans]
MKVIAFCFFLALSMSAFTQTQTVKQLYDEYRKSKYSFANKYRNQTITVTGKIRSISVASDFWKDQDVHKIHLTATGYENFVVCQIPYKDSAILRRFQVGGFLTVTGVVASNISDALFLSQCTFATAESAVKKSSAPANAPLGKYNVYQNDATGFNYQYTFQLKSYGLYILNGKAGNCMYNTKTNIINFSTGPLKGFTGLYRPTTDNENDPPSFLLDAKGKIPDANSSHQGNQFAYYQGR